MYRKFESLLRGNVPEVPNVHLEEAAGAPKFGKDWDAHQAMGLDHHIEQAAKHLKLSESFHKMRNDAFYGRKTRLTRAQAFRLADAHDRWYGAHKDMVDRLSPYKKKLKDID